ncbi:MAG: SPOR domain-containing protein [Candidatus Eisenbacteria bacterium]
MRALRLVWAAAALAALASCAPALREPASLPGAPPAASTPPAPATPRPAAPRSGPSFASPDTVPSPEAVAVLASIPEPLGETAPATKGRRPPANAPKPAPTPAPVPVNVPAPAEAADSLQAGQAPPSDAPPAAAAAAPDTGTIPVPAPTRPLGADATPAAPTPPPATPAAPAPTFEETAAPAAADTCWRVQVGASSQRAKASRLRSAAESQLLMRMVVERERNLWKVRTQDCVGRGTAESLKARAIASGFQGVFLVRYVKRP